MKRVAWLLASAVGVLGLATSPLGCFSSTGAPPEEPDSTPPPQDGAPPADDATTTPPADAGAPPADSGAKDSGPVDAGADAVVIDAGPLPLTLTVLQGGAPEPGVNVVFQDETGAVVTTAVTDTAGTVSQLVVAGSQVTALLGTAGEPNPVTIQGVAPGDALTIADPTSSGSAPGSENVTVTLPAPTWDGSSVYESAYAGSCYNPVTYPLYLYSDCQTAAGEFPLLAVAVDTTTQEEIAYTYQLGNVAQPEGGLPDGATSLPVVVTRPWETSAATATIAATNPPGLPYDGGTTSTANDVQLFYYESAEGLLTSSPTALGATIDDAGTQVQTFTMHPGYPDFIQAEVTDTANTSNGEVFAGAATRVAAQATSLATSFDLSTLPAITGTGLDTADGGMPLQPTVTWTSSGSLAPANGIYVSAQWFSATSTDGGIVYASGTWTVLAPPTSTGVHLPSLPASLSEWAPAPTASFNTSPRVAAVQASFVSGYAGFRAQFGAMPLLSGWQLTVPTLPVNGTVYVVGFYPDEG
jgi:hypothetical protein